MEILYSSPWTPVEWMLAHGFEPLWAGFAARETVSVPEGVCSFAQSLRELAAERPGTPMVLTTACDQMRRAADAVSSGAAPVFLFNLPATWQTDAARALYRSEIHRLGGFLERTGGSRPSPETLESVMRRCDERRQQMRARLEAGSEASTASGRDSMSLTSSIWTQTTNNAARRLARTLASPEHATQHHADPTARIDDVPESRAASRENGAVEGATVPVALIGGPLRWPDVDLFERIAAAGGRVVLNATEPGERSLLPPYGECAGDPIAALADHYFDNMVDVFQRPNTRLYDWLRSLLRSRGARGIILRAYSWCDLWLAEAASLREAFQLPVLTLAAGGGPGGEARDSTRLSAFIESLQ